MKTEVEVVEGQVVMERWVPVMVAVVAAVVVVLAVGVKILCKAKQLTYHFLFALHGSMAIFLLGMVCCDAP